MTNMRMRAGKNKTVQKSSDIVLWFRESNVEISSIIRSIREVLSFADDRGFADRVSVMLWRGHKTNGRPLLKCCQGS